DDEDPEIRLAALEEDRRGGSGNGAAHHDDVVIERVCGSTFHRPSSLPRARVEDLDTALLIHDERAVDPVDATEVLNLTRGPRHDELVQPSLAAQTEVHDWAPRREVSARVGVLRYDR